jgi:hypothetical protein
MSYCDQSKIRQHTNEIKVVDNTKTTVPCLSDSLPKEFDKFQSKINN